MTDRLLLILAALRTRADRALLWGRALCVAALPAGDPGRRHEPGSRFPGRDGPVPCECGVLACRSVETGVAATGTVGSVPVHVGACRRFVCSASCSMAFRGGVLIFYLLAELLFAVLAFSFCANRKKTREVAMFLTRTLKYAVVGSALTIFGAGTASASQCRRPSTTITRSSNVRLRRPVSRPSRRSIMRVWPRPKVRRCHRRGSRYSRTRR